MLASLNRALQHRGSRTPSRAPLRSLLSVKTLAWCWLLPALAGAHAGLHAEEPTLRARLAAIQEATRTNPQRALPMLDKLAPQLGHVSSGERADFLSLSCIAHHRLGQHDRALPLCDQALALGRQAGDRDAVARALLAKAYSLFGMNEMAQSHQLVWEAEKMAASSLDKDLRVRTLISSGESFAEDGNFPTALTRLQAGATLARQSDSPLLSVIALNALAYLYNQMREHAKAFEALDEAYRAAALLDSPGRMAILKTTEYAVAIDSGQMQRGLGALQDTLALARQIGSGPMISTSLVNLSDCYLKLRDYRRALSYAQQALAQARSMHDEALVATALVNIGQVSLAMGRLAEGKASTEAGLAWYEKSGHKPDLQAVLAEYGDALERAGDYAAALAAYHRERTLSNELFEKRRQKAVVELQEKYEADKRQRQIELLRQENQVKSTEIDNRRLQQRIWWLLALVFALASVMVGVLYRKVRQANARLKEKNLELKRQSARDPLTGLYNRRHFQECMRGQEAGAHKDGAGHEEPAGALFLLDVDHFKHINDTYGHGAGDAVLREIADGLREILRETDMIVRWGGEEFLAFLPTAPRDRLDEVARRLLTGIPARGVAWQGLTLTVQVSIGYAPFPLAQDHDAAGLSWERAVNIVDMALYLAKGHGRNRAYGVRGLGRLDRAALEDIEQDIERAWRAGDIDLAIVLGNPAELRAVG